MIIPYHMLSSGDRALDRWREQVTRENYQTVLTAIIALILPFRSDISQKGCKLGNVDGLFFVVHMNLLLRDLIDVVEVGDIEDRGFWCIARPLGATLPEFDPRRVGFPSQACLRRTVVNNNPCARSAR